MCGGTARIGYFVLSDVANLLRLRCRSRWFRGLGRAQIFFHRYLEIQQFLTLGVTYAGQRDVRARQRLREALALIGQPREFCIAVSDTLRQYLEERFNFHAPERTTEEFLYELRETELLTRDQKASLEDFLTRCDLVKFARYEPFEPELHDLHDSAVRMVDETEPMNTTPDTASVSRAPVPVETK